MVTSPAHDADGRVGPLQPEDRSLETDLRPESRYPQRLNMTPNLNLRNFLTSRQYLRSLWASQSMSLGEKTIPLFARESRHHL